MTLPAFVILMFVSTAAAWTAWFTVLFKIDPFVDGGLGFLLFYLSLGLSLTGTITLLGMTVRHFYQPEEASFRRVLNSFRQAAFLSVLVVALLFLQSHRLLAWWNVLLLILACVVLEVFWLVYTGKRR